jgi:putative hydrolase of the HAD superfamily
MEKPRLVLFDIGNVLISLNPIPAALPLEALSRDGVGAAELEKAVQAFRESSVVERFERGLSSAKEFCAGVRAAFRSALPDEEISRRYVRILGAEVPGMGHLIDDLKRLGVRVAALTNTDPLHLEVILKYPAVKSLENVVASCAIGKKKPAPEAFLDALRVLEVEPGETYFTDDLAANVEGARGVGIRADLFTGLDSLRQALRLEKR